MKTHYLIFFLFVAALIPATLGYVYRSADDDDFSGEITGEEIYVGPQDEADLAILKGQASNNFVGEKGPDEENDPKDEEIYALKATIYFLRDDLKNIRNYFPNLNATSSLNNILQSDESFGSDGDEYGENNVFGSDYDSDEDYGGLAGDGDDYEEEEYSDIDPSLHSDYEDPFQPPDKPFVEFSDITVPSVLGGAGIDETGFAPIQINDEPVVPTRPPTKPTRATRPTRRPTRPNRYGPSEFDNRPSRPGSANRPQRPQRKPARPFRPNRRRPRPNRRPNRNKRRGNKRRGNRNQNRPNNNNWRPNRNQGFQGNRNRHKWVQQRWN